MKPAGRDGDAERSEVAGQHEDTTASVSTLNQGGIMSEEHKLEIQPSLAHCPYCLEMNAGDNQLLRMMVDDRPVGWCCDSCKSIYDFQGHFTVEEGRVRYFGNRRNPEFTSKLRGNVVEINFFDEEGKPQPHTKEYLIEAFRLQKNK